MQGEGPEPNSVDEDWDAPTTADRPRQQTLDPAQLLQFQLFHINAQGQDPNHPSCQVNDAMQVHHQPDSDMDPNSLIQQFNCLGTTDKDVLVSQLQKFIGPNLNKDAAQFFLDMNDWNLQRAIGSYFDLSDDQALWGENGTVLRPSQYSMVLVDGPARNEVSVCPNLKLNIGWRIMNDGGERWPPGTHLRLGNHHHAFVFPEKVFLTGNQFGVPPGITCDVILDMTSPPNPGTYNATYHVTTPEGYYIGAIINLTLNVIHDETMDLSQQFQNLRWNGNGGNDGSGTGLGLGSNVEEMS